MDLLLRSSEPAIRIQLLQSKNAALDVALSLATAADICSSLDATVREFAA